MSAGKTLTVSAIEELSSAADDWIPEPKDIMRMNESIHFDLSPSHSDSFHALSKGRKIGQKTFSEGHLDAVLLLACREGNMEVVSSLLKIFTKYFSIDTLIACSSVPGIDRAKIRFDELILSDKVSLLHSAAMGGKLDVVKLLLSFGADVNNPSRWSNIPLTSALSVCDPTVEKTIACLIESGTNVQYRDAEGLTPLMYAAISASVCAVCMLLQAGADPYAINNEGYTVLHYACRLNCTAVVEHLLGIAPRLIILRGENSSACLAPYLTAASLTATYMQGMTRVQLSDPQSPDLATLQLFLVSPHCPPEIKENIQLLKSVSQAVSRAVCFILLPNRFPLRSRLRDAEKMLQVAESSIAYPSVPIIQILSAAVLDSLFTARMSKVTPKLALRLSEMLLFRLQNNQCLTWNSWHDIFVIWSKFVLVARLYTTSILLDAAISIFIELVHSQQKVSAGRMYMMYDELHSSSLAIIDCLVFNDLSDQTTHRMISKFTSNCPLLVDKSTGYVDSLLHFALCRCRLPSLPVLETFLKCGGHKWINTPGSNGYRPLHFVRTTEFASLLVDYGAHLDAVDVNGFVPKYSVEYYKSHPRPLSCIVARFIVKMGGMMEHEIGLLPRHVRAFISFHDSHATRSQMDRKAAEYY